jgi:hypothetical protein
MPNSRALDKILSCAALTEKSRLTCSSFSLPDPFRAFSIKERTSLISIFSDLKSFGTNVRTTDHSPYLIKKRWICFSRLEVIAKVSEYLSRSKRSAGSFSDINAGDPLSEKNGSSGVRFFEMPLKKDQKYSGRVQVKSLRSQKVSVRKSKAYN